MRKLIVFLFASFITFFVVASNPNVSKQVTVNGIQYYQYTVQKSEGFYAISTKFGVTQDDIILANPSTKEGLRVGQEILIPIKTEAKKENYLLHTVEKGETVFSISQKYKISKEEIYSLNPETKEVLKIGSTIKIKSNATTENKPTNPSPTSIPQKTSVTDKPIQQISDNNKENTYIEHKVRRRETLHSISELYDVEIDAIIKENPSVVNGLIVRSILRIPMGKKVQQVEAITEKAFEEKPIAPIPQTSVVANKQDKKTHIKIAVLMPFELEATVRDAGMDRFVEFYQGILIATDSLAQHGITIEVEAHDIGKTQNQLTKTLGIPSLKEVDIIFGPAYSSQIPALANFAKLHKIKLVVPFSPTVPEIESNEYLYQVITPQSDLHTSIAKEFSKVFSNKLVYFLQPRKDNLQDKKEFVNQLKVAFNQNKVSYRTGFLGDFSASRLDSIANSTNKELVLIVPSTNLVVVTQLSNMIQSVQSSSIRIFSFSEWHQLQIQDLYQLPHYTYTNYYIDFKDSNIHAFFTKLRNTYGIAGTQSVPNYALLGYDLANYFIGLLSNYGSNFESKLQEKNNGLLQMNLQFEKVSVNGGYQNKGIFLQSYDQQGITTLK